MLHRVHSLIPDHLVFGGPGPPSASSRRAPASQGADRARFTSSTRARPTAPHSPGPPPRSAGAASRGEEESPPPRRRERAFPWVGRTCRCRFSSKKRSGRAAARIVGAPGRNRPSAIRPNHFFCGVRRRDTMFGRCPAPVRSMLDSVSRHAFPVRKPGHRKVLSRGVLLGRAPFEVEDETHPPKRSARLGIACSARPSVYSLLGLALGFYYRLLGSHSVSTALASLSWIGSGLRGVIQVLLAMAQWSAVVGRVVS